MRSGEAFDLDPLAMSEFRLQPLKRVHAAVHSRALRVIHLPVVPYEVGTILSPRRKRLTASWPNRSQQPAEVASV